MLVFHARTETDIAAPPDVVFEILSDVSRHSELSGSGEVLKIRQLTEGPLAAGTRFEADEDLAFGPSRMKFVATSEVVTYDPPQTFSWTSMPPNKPQPRRIQWWFRLTPTANGTHVVHEVEVDLGPVMNIDEAAV